MFELFRPMFEFLGRAPQAGFETLEGAVLWRPLLYSNKTHTTKSSARKQAIIRFQLQ